MDRDNRAKQNETAALFVEAMFGEQITRCRRCNALDAMTNEYARAAMRCRECGWLEANERVAYVPKDARLR